MTNSKTSQCGIYELPKRIIEIETGYNRETVQKLLQRFVDYGKIDYFEGTKELMIKKWIKYNPPNNDNAKKCIVKELNEVKNLDFSMIYVEQATEEGYLLEGLIRGLQGAYKTLPSNKVISNKEEVINKKDKPVKIPYAEYVSMTEDEYNKLVQQYGKDNVNLMISKLDNYKGAKGKQYKSDYRAILSWVADEIMSKFSTKPEEIKPNAAAYKMI